jgi:hypothetical protein
MSGVPVSSSAWAAITERTSKARTTHGAPHGAQGVGGFADEAGCMEVRVSTARERGQSQCRPERCCLRRLCVQLRRKCHHEICHLPGWFA